MKEAIGIYLIYPNLAGPDDADTSNDIKIFVITS